MIIGPKDSRAQMIECEFRTVDRFIAMEACSSEPPKRGAKSLLSPKFRFAFANLVNGLAVLVDARKLDPFVWLFSVKRMCRDHSVQGAHSIALNHQHCDWV